MNTQDNAKELRTGRPSTYSRETAQEICLRIAEGESLRQVCRDQDMPDRSTVYRWLEAEPGFRDQYRRARDMLMDYWAEEIVEIADDTALDTVTKLTPQGREYEAVDHENIQRSKLRVNTRQWLMSKLAPKKYGERVEHEHTGQVGHDHRHTLDDKELMRRFALFLHESPGAPALIDGEATSLDDDTTPALMASDEE
jgi:hypothetical protein